MRSRKKRRIPGGETLLGLRRRAGGAVKSLASAHPGETIVLVGHDAINRAVLLFVLGMRNRDFWRLGQGTCAINVFDWSESYRQVFLLNGRCHLLGDGLQWRPGGEIQAGADEVQVGRHGFGSL